MTVYYSEWDPYAADWLRNLIKAGHIPDGEVDTRSIVDVEPADLRGFTQWHFFAGISGWSRALRIAQWPEDRSIASASLPCQPFSNAGKQKGKDDERHLWPVFFRLVTECRFPTIIGEQVASKIGREWLSGVRSDLEGVGYVVGAADLCAASVNAPHIRQRLFWVAKNMADTDSQRPQGQRPDSDTSGRRGQDISASGLCGRAGDGDMADASGSGQLERRNSSGDAAQVECTVRGGEEPRPEHDGELSGRIEGLHRPSVFSEHASNDRWWEREDAQQHEMRRNIYSDMADAPLSANVGGEPQSSVGSVSQGNGGGDAAAGYLDMVHSEGHADNGPIQSGERQEVSGSVDAGGIARSDMAHPDSGGCGGRQEEQERGEERRVAAERAGPWDDAEWLTGADGKTRRALAGVRLLVNGIPGGGVAYVRTREDGTEEKNIYSRVGALRCFGNAIVPPLAAEFIKAIMDDLE